MVDYPALHERIEDPAEGETIIADGVSFQDFLTRFSEGHYEWVMGKVIYVVSNSRPHAAIIAFLIHLFQLYLGFKQIGRVFATGYPQYVGDDRPAREPDILVVLNDRLDRTQPTYLDGPADLAVEVVSPESHTRDRGTKMREYEAAGVREYWLIDYRRQEAICYKLDAQGIYRATPLNAHGRLASSLLPGFSLDPNWLWNENFPHGEALVEAVRAMAVSST